MGFWIWFQLMQRKGHKIQIWNLDRLTHIQFNVWSRLKAWKVKEITHDSNHDLTFYCIRNQLCMHCVCLYKDLHGVCQSIKSMFRVLGILNFGARGSWLTVEQLTQSSKASKDWCKRFSFFFFPSYFGSYFSLWVFFSFC